MKRFSARDGWFIVLLGTIYMFNFIDRMIISVVGEPIRREFGLSDFQLGIMGGAAFARLYGGVGIPLARLAERLLPVVTPHEEERLSALIDIAYAYEPFATLRPRDFVAHVRQKKVEDPRASSVRVMTVHQSKGLEFDAVVLCELETALVPTNRSPVPASKRGLDRSWIFPTSPRTPSRNPKSTSGASRPGPTRRARTSLPPDGTARSRFFREPAPATRPSRN